MASILEAFDIEIETTLDNLGPRTRVRIYNQRECKTQICSLLASNQHTLVGLGEIFHPYMADARPMNEFVRRNKLIYRFFRSLAIGTVAVFATSDLLDPTGLSFATWQERPDSTERKQCVSAELLQVKHESHKFVITCVPLRMCAGCSNTMDKAYKCSRCRAADVHVRYCGKQCQRDHWVHHRLMCG